MNVADTVLFPSIVTTHVFVLDVHPAQLAKVYPVFGAAVRVTDVPDTNVEVVVATPFTDFVIEPLGDEVVRVWVRGVFVPPLATEKLTFVIDE